jgi:conjugative transfer pilus assembly protein TraH
MTKKIISIAILLSLFTVSFQTTTSGDMGSFMDNAITQLQGLSPTTYQGQQRGYYMGGSASIRIPQETIQPFSFTPPKISAGCGGIDIAMGGFSYLNFDALIQKLQKILQAAPAMAFDLALGVLCESCKNIMHSLEHFADLINSMNLDSCKATKAVLGYAATQLQQVSSYNLAMGNFDSYFRASSDANSNFVTDYQNWINAYSGVYDCNTLTGSAQHQCNGAQAKISGFKVPMWQQVFNGTDEYTWLIPVFRAYYGDIFQQDGAQNSDGTDQANMVIGVGGCAQKATSNIVDALITGQVTVKTALTDGDSSCSVQTYSSYAIQTIVTNHLQNILNAIKAGSTSSLTPDDINFINSTTLPVYKLISLGALFEKVTGDSTGYWTSNFVTSVAVPLSYDVALSLLKDTLKYVDSMLQSAMAKDSNDDVGGETQELFQTASQRIRDDIKQAEEERVESWKAFKESFGDMYQKNIEMQQTIYAKMAETKLLSSLQWARGIR